MSGFDHIDPKSFFREQERIYGAEHREEQSYRRFMHACHQVLTTRAGQESESLLNRETGVSQLCTLGPTSIGAVCRRGLRFGATAIRRAGCRADADLLPGSPVAVRSATVRTCCRAAGASPARGSVEFGSGDAAGRLSVAERLALCPQAGRCLS